MKPTITPLTTDEQIYNKIEELYKTNPKFILHIVRSILPCIKVTRVSNFIKQGLKNRRCCISDQTLIDISTVAYNISKRDMVDMNYILPFISDPKTPIRQIESDICGTKRLAIIGESSDKMYCIDAYKQLQIFIKNMVNIHDRHFNRILYSNICTYYKDEITKRFDVSIRWSKLPSNIKNEFIMFIDERSINEMYIKYESVWETIGERIISKQPIQKES